MKADDIFVPTSAVAAYTERQRQSGKLSSVTRSPSDKPAIKIAGARDKMKKRKAG